MVHEYSISLVRHMPVLLREYQSSYHRTLELLLVQNDSNHLDSRMNYRLELEYGNYQLNTCVFFQPKHFFTSAKLSISGNTCLPRMSSCEERMSRWYTR